MTTVWPQILFIRKKLISCFGSISAASVLLIGLFIYFYIRTLLFPLHRQKQRTPRQSLGVDPLRLTSHCFQTSCSHLGTWLHESNMLIIHSRQKKTWWHLWASPGQRNFCSDHNKRMNYHNYRQHQKCCKSLKASELSHLSESRDKFKISELKNGMEQETDDASLQLLSGESSYTP